MHTWDSCIKIRRNRHTCCFFPRNLYRPLRPPPPFFLYSEKPARLHGSLLSSKVCQRLSITGLWVRVRIQGWWYRTVISVIFDQKNMKLFFAWTLLNFTGFANLGRSNGVRKKSLHISKEKKEWFWLKMGYFWSGPTTNMNPFRGWIAEPCRVVMGFWG